ncbi:hypothetical protein RJ639_041687 [Escallonia herrerae]|uniref:Transcription repressor n=1 Tax=Escallonia herrerae TaxID=1293975 RepID=A0AA89B320_9ASTE|nr:hypothetical protein RJ639_041687 [Escallonia herrerae]
MSTNKKKLILTSVKVNLGCSSCSRPRLLSHIFHPKPKHKNPSFQKPTNNMNYYYSSSSWYTTATATAFSPNTATPSDYYSDMEPDIKSLRAVQGFGRIGGDSLAVEKDSDDPYLDFRHSMLQMILEKEIYSKDDLRELLNCFLQLNSPYHHGIIVRAFTEIWNGVFSIKSGGS